MKPQGMLWLLRSLSAPVQKEKTMGLTIPSRVELLYSLSPDVLKPHIDVQGKLAQLVKHEARARAERGESLTFRLSPSGLFAIDVRPSGQYIPHAGANGNLELVVKRKEPPTGPSTPGKEVSQFLLSEEIYPSPG